MGKIPSITALSVAIGTFLCYHMEKFKHLIPEQKAKLFKYIATEIIKTYPITIITIFFKIAFYLPYFVQVRILDYFIPGYCVHMVMRKQYIEDCVRSAITDGARQIVICAAGFDMSAVYLTSELKEIEDLKFFELDLESTQKYKTNALSKFKKMCENEQYTQCFKHINYISCDLLTNDWYQILLEHGFDPEQPSIIIAEGFTMYLDKASADRFFHNIRHKLLINPISLMITSFLTIDDPSYCFNQGNNDKLNDIILKKNQESYKFVLLSNEVASFCENSGFEIVDSRTRISFQKDAGNIRAIKQINQQAPAEDYYILRPFSNNVETATHI